MIEKIIKYWDAVAKKREEEIITYFSSDAIVRWHNTNEEFTVGEFLRANCDYPGDFDGKVERIEQIGHLFITVARIWATDNSVSVHCTSFIQMENGLIKEVDEYWGEDGPAPQWRLDMRLGKAIK